MSDDPKLPDAASPDSDRPETNNPEGSYFGDRAVPPPSKGRGNIPGRWIFLIVVILVLATQIYLVRGCQQTTMDLTGGVADRFAQAFSRNVTEEFLSTAPEMASDSRYLVATITMTEVMTREVKKTIPLWPDEIQAATLNVRVTYNYAVPFERERWDLLLTHHPGPTGTSEGGVLICDVIAPSLEPVLPPAADTSEMTIRRYNNGLSRFDQGMVDSLIRDMTPRFTTKSYGYLDLVRELGRNQVKHFVQTWILISEHAELAEEIVVRVSFRDELDSIAADGPESEILESATWDLDASRDSSAVDNRGFDANR